MHGSTHMKKHKREQPDLKRRKLLRDAGAVAVCGSGVLAAAAADQSSAAPCNRSGCDYDVVVIGGGFAGVTASRDCRENGYRTLLLEARNRLGGRTFGADFEGTHVELGGFWIHHTQPFVWAEKERYGLEIVDTPGANPDVMSIVVDGKLVEMTLEQIYEAVGGWQAYAEAGRTILPRSWDLLFNREAALKADSISAVEQLEASNLNTLQKRFIKVLIASMANNHPEEMSYLEMLRWYQCGGGYFPTFMDSVGRFALKEGTYSLVEKMIEDGKPDVRLSTPVKSIEDEGDKIVITTIRGEKISARVAIACLPMNTMINIDFTPALPDGVVEAGKARHNGAGIKIYIKAKGDVGNLTSMGGSYGLDYVMTYKQTEKYTVLVGFGRDPKLLDVYDDEAVQQALSELVPGAELLSSVSYDWNNDPYARGTWASYKPGWVAKYYDDFNKDLGRIYFGSSDHGEGWRGFIDGAIGGGIKAAQRVKERLG